jgi:hypothetical protein
MSYKHDYDDPSKVRCARDFLELVRRDPTVSMTLRIQAAKEILRLYGNTPWPDPIAYTVQIGGIPEDGGVGGYPRASGKPSPMGIEPCFLEGAT